MVSRNEPVPSTVKATLRNDYNDDVDNVEIPVVNGAISSVAFEKLGTLMYDPGYQNTAVVRSAISYIDGEAGILEYRGYRIEELAEKSSFLEVAHLLIYGELPGSLAILNEWQEKIMRHTFVHSKLTEMLGTFHYDAHPMGIFITAMASMSTFHPEANPALLGSDLYTSPVISKDKESDAHREEKNQKLALMNKQIVRILGKAPTVAAAAYRHRIGRPLNLPQADLGYAENFLSMLDRMSENGSDYKPHPVFVKALDVLFILHAEHEMNCSTATMRQIASSRADPYCAVAGAAAALYGPLHGGANEAVLRMLEEIREVENVPVFLEKVKSKQSGARLMGFGHRIYRSYDPRARIIQNLAYSVFEVCGEEPLVRVAIALEKAALADEYFVSRKLYPNVDFYSGLIYRAMGFPMDFFPVLFAIPRLVGWLAHWREAMIDGKDGPIPRIWRPRQVYVGFRNRKFIALEERDPSAEQEERPGEIPQNPYYRRYLISSSI